MDIYKYAEETNALVNYFDFDSGRIYQVAAYNNARRFGLPTPGIGVVDGVTGEFLGYAKRMDRSSGASCEFDHAPEEEREPEEGDHPAEAIYVLESGVDNAPNHMQEWFRQNPEFRIAAVSKDSVWLAPSHAKDATADPRNWLMVGDVKFGGGAGFSGWFDLTLKLAEKKFPNFISCQHNGGNVNAKNGGFSICMFLQRIIWG